jgi:hypothetical protein
VHFQRGASVRVDADIGDALPDGQRDRQELRSVAGLPTTFIASLAPAL